MSDYADTGFLCSLYAPDAHSERAIARMEQQGSPILFTWLHQIEFRNALRLRVYRGEITRAQREASLRHIQADLTDGFLQLADPSHANLVLETERLSATFSEKLGTRSLDIMHVAMAIVLGSRNFISFDQRQLKLARSVGLDIPAL